MGTGQKSIKDLVTLATASGANLAILAAVLAFISLLVPFIGLSVDTGLFGRDTGSMNGFQAASWPASLTLAAFAAAAAARRLDALRSYRSLIDVAVIGLVIVTIAWAWLYNPAVQATAQMNSLGQMFGGGKGRPSAQFFPHVGMAMLVLAASILIFARGRDR